MRRFVLVLASTALLVAGCGGDDSSSSSTPAKTATAAPASGGGSSSGGAVTIKMQNIQFAPKDTTVKVGQKVTWVNEDSAPHNVTGGPIKSQTFGKGQSFSYTPTKAGTISYVCTIHPGMDGKLTVTGG